MLDRVKGQGVTIAIQNHHDLGLHTEALIEMLHDIDRPNCKLGFDSWSPALRGESLYEAARLAAPHTVLTTNADNLYLVADNLSNQNLSNFCANIKSRQISVAGSICFVYFFL